MSYDIGHYSKFKIRTVTGQLVLKMPGAINGARKYSPPCSSRIAEGVIRGIFVGFAWTAAIDLPAALSEKKTIVKNTSRAFISNSTGFALFLATYSGMTCLSEKVRGQDDWKNSFVGGFATGMGSGLRNPNVKQVVGTALFVGTIAGLVHRSHANK